MFTDEGNCLFLFFVHGISKKDCFQSIWQQKAGDVIGYLICRLCTSFYDPFISTYSTSYQAYSLSEARRYSSLCKL